MNNIKSTLREASNRLGIRPKSKFKITELPTIEYCSISVCLSYISDKKKYYNI